MTMVFPHSSSVTDIIDDQTTPDAVIFTDYYRVNRLYANGSIEIIAGPTAATSGYVLIINNLEMLNNLLKHFLRLSIKNLLRF